MLTRILLAGALGVVYGWSQSPAIPDTAAGKALGAWMTAFNSGDRSRMEAYAKQYEPARSVDDDLRFREATGGFDLTAIEKSEPLSVAFRVKESGGRGITARGRFEMKADGPPRVTSFSLRALPPNVTEADLNRTIDATERTRVIDGIVVQLKENYVFPEVAEKMTEAVRQRQRRGEYDALTDGDTFASRLTEHLREVSKDKHLRVDYSPTALPLRPPGGPRSPEDRARRQKQLESMNCGFDKVERLAPSNIGHLKFNGFLDPRVCGPTVTAAMNFLANVDALIVDLRENGGGDPKMVALISSYLFDESTHLNDLFNRKENTTEQYWTSPYVPGKRLASQPVYVLTSRRTFSGAEEFSYNLKNLKRATIVGETTGGGAHPVSGHRIDDHFMILNVAVAYRTCAWQTVPRTVRPCGGLPVRAAPPDSGRSAAPPPPDRSPASSGVGG
jgi:hypothetical protein